jgi:sugar/nucleoside kinase (ribokinase family)
MSRPILGLGAIAIDYTIKADDDLMQSLSGEKGGMEHLSFSQFQNLLDGAGGVAHTSLGGCTTNKLKGLSRLGHSVLIHGAVGKDDESNVVRSGLEGYGIRSRLVTFREPTTRVLCFVDRDGGRTFRTYPGAGSKLSPSHLERSLFSDASLLIIEGYLMSNPGLVEAAMEMGKAAGLKIIFDLGCLEYCHLYGDDIRRLLQKHVDILFANRHEVEALLKMSPQEGCHQLQQWVEIAVVSMSEEGCWVGHQGKIEHYPALPVENPSDTTGAGDLFASGFIHGYLCGRPMKDCAHLGALIANAVVQVDGTDIPDAQWEKILQNIE